MGDTGCDSVGAPTLGGGVSRLSAEVLGALSDCTTTGPCPGSAGRAGGFDRAALSPCETGGAISGLAGWADTACAPAKAVVIIKSATPSTRNPRLFSLRGALREVACEAELHRRNVS